MVPGGSHKAAAGRTTGHNPLSAIGVDDTTHRIYRDCLGSASPTLEGLTLLRRVDPATVAASLRKLAALGLLGLLEGGQIEVRDPVVALENLVLAEKQALGQRARELDALRAAQIELQEAYWAGEQQRRPDLGFQVIRGIGRIRAVAAALRAACREEILLANTSPETYRARSIAATIREDTSSDDRGVRQRSLYPSSIFESPRMLAYARDREAKGEESRVSRRLPFRFIIIDRDVAMVPLDPKRADVALVVRSPPLVFAIVELYEMLWLRASPLSPSPGGSSPADETDAIASLLRAGAKDEIVARSLGLSLRTVRRRIADLMVDLGAGTRFQAGYQLAREESRTTDAEGFSAEA